VFSSVRIVMKSRAAFSLLWLGLSLTAGLDAAESRPRHVVVLVWDGMRRDFISAATTPHLWALAQRGVFFANHHPVYLSSTEVNGVALATGAYPAHSTVIGNTEFRPRLDPEKPVAIEKPEIVRRGDTVSQGHYLAVETLAEILHAKGVLTAIAGSKQIALLQDRALRSDDASSSPIVFEGAALPASMEKKLVQVLGAFPPPALDPVTGKPVNRLARDVWTTRALLEVLWQDGVPPYSLLWLAEPDYSQHTTGPGSPASLTGIKSSDTHLGEVLAELDRRGLRADTDVLVVSDHGFSTISKATDIAVDLSAAGFDVARAMPGGLRPGRVLIQSNSGTIFFYVGGHDPVLTEKIAAWAQTQPWAGVIFAREPIEGTFMLNEAHLDSPEAPDLAIALRWTADKSSNGTPGLVYYDGSERGVGQGNHTSLSATDMANTLVAAGPDFRPGVRDTIASANTDVVPTVLWILGYRDEAQKRDGRVLSEALVGVAPPLRAVELQHLTAQRDTPAGLWLQYLQITEVNGVRYLDEGNGSLSPVPAK
jgi:arylsulfatase A-like enzyme